MWFVWCRSVHTIGMTMSIRVVCLDRSGRVRLNRVVLPGRVLLARQAVRHIIECAPDADVRVGDRFPSLVERGLSAAGGKRPATLRPSRR
jgi:hypothetical protein